jgi:putative (di)nucleoside polyphosphate hydrolase
VVSFKREVYVRALRHLAPFARSICGDEAISQQDAPQLPELQRRRGRG